VAPDDERLLKLASSISDGSPVDWDDPDSAGLPGDEPGLIAELRSLAAIAEFQRRPTPLEVVRPAARFGHLEIIETIGTGSFGEVFRARDVRLDREVALKMMEAAPAFPRTGSPDVHDRVLREARHMARVRHENVVAVYGAEINAGRVGIWMELVTGRTLSDIVRNHGRFSAREAASAGAVLCRALAAVHGAGLLHLDLKPRNIMREEGGRLVLMDFGMGQELFGPPTGAGIGGTPAYMAPERLDGSPPTPVSDLYSLGVVLYFLVTGTVPVDGTTLAELYEAHDKGRVRRLRDVRPDLPAGFVNVVERATDPDPAARYSTAGEMEKALAALPDGDGGSARAGEAHARTGRRPSFFLILAFAIPALFLLAMGARRFLPWPDPTGSRTAETSGPATGAAGTMREADQPLAGNASPPAGIPGTGVPAAPREGTTLAPGGSSLSAAAGAPYTIEASFHRGDDLTRPLQAGDQVGVGDSLSLSIQASEPLHVYVINEDDKGDAYLLFPLPGFQPSNPVPAARTSVLPGSRDGRRYFWQVTSAGGREHFLVVASRERLKELEADLLALARPAAGAPLEYARLSDASRRRLRGVGGLVEAPSREDGSADVPLFELARGLQPGAEAARGVWIRRIDLENPAR
jgi:serine/threonine-protein kinase